MKKILFLLALLLLPLGVAEAQKVALVDMEFILKKDPAYTAMTRQIDDLSKRWQDEVTSIEKKAETAYKSYQGEAAFLSADQKKAREESIVALEKQAYDLKRKYFGPEGDLFKRREGLMKPIQDRVWTAMKELARRGGLQLIIDRSSSKIVYADPALDVSESIVSMLGLSGR
ncbi:MAG: OmpH family outer membrane protein [Porphyromonas sp.]|jgi:cationic outer membrane protein ompH